MNDFLENILQSKFYALLLHFAIKCPALRLCYFRCHWCRNLAAIKCIVHWIVLTLCTLQMGITLDHSCMSLLWFHYNHKVCVSYHKKSVLADGLFKQIALL